MRDIYKRISLAQIASDGGKGIEELRSYSENTWKKGYSRKDKEILRAIELIRKGKGYDVKYFIKPDYYSQNLQKVCYIVYFNFTDSGKQVSFHSFCEDLSKYLGKRNSFHTTRWKKKLSSRDVVKEILAEDR